MTEHNRDEGQEVRKEQLDKLLELVTEAASKAKVNVNWQESGKYTADVEKRLLGWLVGVATLLLVSGITAAVVGYGNFQALQKVVEAQQRELDQHQRTLEYILEGRSGVTRGGPNGPTTP